MLYSRFGMKSHNGIDYVAPYRTPLLAVEDGVIVQEVEEKGGFGRHIKLLGDAKDENGHQNEWTYAHNAQHFVEVGERVKRGQMIASMGNSGFVVSGGVEYWEGHNPHAGTHLHLGLRKTLVTDDGGWMTDAGFRLKTINYDNGWKGAIDFHDLIKNASQSPEEGLEAAQEKSIGLLQRLVENLKRATGIGV